MYKKIFYLGILAYVVLFIFSIIFYKERIVFADAAHYMIYITKNDSFYFLFYRFGSTLLQILPLLGIKAGLGLDKIILLYSISFPLYYFSCYLLCGFAFKNYRIALVLLLFNTIFVTHTFYYMISELPLAIAMLLTLFAYIDHKKQYGLWQIIVSVAILITIVFYHPLTVFAIVYCLIFFYACKENAMVRKKLLLLTGIYMIIFITKKIYFTAHYDIHGLESLDNAKNILPHFFNLYSNKVFLKNCIDKYYWIPILLLLISIVYIIKRQWLKLSLFICSALGYLLLVNVCFPTDYTTAFYIENLYLPIGLFIALPFAYDVIPVLQEKRLSFMMVLVITVTACARIYANHNVYTNRINWERKFLDKHLNEKMLIEQTKGQLDTLLMTWGTPYEFWMLSTTEYNKTASIIITEDVGYLMPATTKKNVFVVAWDNFPYNSLPAKYFILTDTVNTYKLGK